MSSITLRLRFLSALVLAPTVACSGASGGPLFGDTGEAGTPATLDDAGSVAASMDAGGGSADGAASADGAPSADRCASDQVPCEGACVSARDPAHGCGAASCAPCAVPHAIAACKDGA